MKHVVLTIAAVLLSSCAEMQQSLPLAAELITPPAKLAPSSGESLSAAQQALEKGVSKGIASLQKAGGFQESIYRIALPAEVQKYTQLARQLGMQNQVDQFEASINKAAEQAVGTAAPIFRKAIAQLTVPDIARIMTGSDQAATEYFRSQSEAELLRSFQPIVAQATEKNQVAQLYRQLTTSLKPAALLAGIPMPTVDLNEYVSQQATSALFKEIGKQEQLIRRNPLERGSALLQKVYGYYAQAQAPSAG